MPGPAWRDWVQALGSPDDAVATDTTSRWSLISLFKAIYQVATDGTLVAAATGRAESFVSLCQGSVALCAQYMRSARASKTAAATSATNAGTSETNAATSASTASASAGIATDAVNFSAGTALYGQRARKDRVAAAASATAAAASAASITSEGLVLGVQVYS